MQNSLNNLQQFILGIHFLFYIVYRTFNNRRVRIKYTML